MTYEDGFTISRMGNSYPLKKSQTHFAVKKKPDAPRAVLAGASVYPENFEGLFFENKDSPDFIELYSIQANCLEQAMEVLRSQCKDIIWASHVYYFPADPDGLLIPTSSIYIEFANQTSNQKIDSILIEHGLKIFQTYKEDPNFLTANLTLESPVNPIKVANALLENDCVLVAEPDFLSELELAPYYPDDPLISKKFHLENFGGNTVALGADISAPEAWEITRGQPDITICIMDDGVDTNQRAFSASKKVVSPREFDTNENAPLPIFSHNNHGTVCAKIALGDEENSGEVGVASNCTLMPIRMRGRISDKAIKDYFDHARLNGASIISCSWGVKSSFFPLGTQAFKAIQKAAKQGRGGLGCIIVFAAGNENRPISGFHKGKRVLSGFASHPDVITISASNREDQKSPYSNFGSEVWICAPSSSNDQQISTESTVDFGGTSSAAPLVAGVCGLILSAKPNLCQDDVKMILKKTCKKINLKNGKYDGRGHSIYYGWGKVDAEQAVRFASAYKTNSQIRNSLSRRLTFRNSPNAPISEYFSRGISDYAPVNEPGKIEDIEVAINIHHPYRGDLETSITGPDGTKVVLNNREGGIRDNIPQTFNLKNSPNLENFLGKHAAGSFTLNAADHAQNDIGILRDWSLTIEMTGAKREEWKENRKITIPDNDPEGIVRELKVNGYGSASNLELTVDISHTWTEDLVIKLESPDNHEVTLHDREGGSTQNLKKTYTTVRNPILEPFVKKVGEINGVWKLKVYDLDSSDIGVLNSWKLKLTTE
jgi:subtilisin-like proprotein convertase family protein/subtilisin family serine protease